MKFKVGDRVKVKISIDGIKVGTVMTVNDIDYDNELTPYLIDGGNGIAAWAKENELEVAMKFKVNDRVILAGGIFTISDIDTEDSTYLIGNTWYDEEQLKAAPSKLADLLGVKDNEPFNVVEEDGEKVDDYNDSYEYLPWKVCDGILVDCDGDSIELSSELISGEYKAVPVKGEWSDGDRMFYVDYDGSIKHTSFNRGCHGDVALVMSGNAFHTRAAAEENQQRISEAIVEKLGEC